MKNKSLLFNYIDTNIKKCSEPIRAGFPRDKPRGFSKKKQEMALYRLTNWLLKDIAKKIEISHALSRKWDTEEKFKEEVSNKCGEYAKYFWAYWHEKGIKYRSTGIISYDELDDSNNYSIELLKEIADYYNEHEKNKTSPIVQDIIYNAVKKIVGHDKNIKLSDLHITELNSEKSEAITQIEQSFKEILRNKKIDKKTRKHIECLLNDEIKKVRAAIDIASST
jgi:hypothetical protein